MQPETTAPYDSTADTLAHLRRVGELMGEIIAVLVGRSYQHDVSKLHEPEKGVYDEFVPKLQEAEFGSEEYRQLVAAMGAGVEHHYAANRHHIEHHGERGVRGMTLMDLTEMLADWSAAAERRPGGDLAKSMQVQRERYGLSDELHEILWNTARELVWLRGKPCGKTHTWPDGVTYTCNVPLDGLDWHWGGHADGSFDGGQAEWWGSGARRFGGPDG